MTSQQQVPVFLYLIHNDCTLMHLQPGSPLLFTQMDKQAGLQVVGAIFFFLKESYSLRFTKTEIIQMISVD